MNVPNCPAKASRREWLQFVKAKAARAGADASALEWSPELEQRIAKALCDATGASEVVWTP